MNILSIEHLTRVYGTGDTAVTALNDVSFTVEAGEFIAIIGSSGSGKSTLMHLMGGVDRPTSGTDRLQGQDIFARNDEQLAVFRRREVGLIYQFYNLIPVLDVVENMTLPVLMDGRSVNEQRVSALVRALGHTGREHCLPQKLSGGQQQRGALGRALKNAPARGRAAPPTATGAHPPRGVFWHFAARSLKLNRSRTLVSIIGVALSCALITAIFTSVATLYEGLLKAEIVTEGAWQVELVNVPEDEIDVVHADSRVTRSYDRISYGDAIMPKSFEGYWGRYLSVQEWPTADKVKGLKPLPHIAEGRAPQAPDEIVLTHNLKGLTVEDGSWLYDSLPTSGKDDDVPHASWDGSLEIGSVIDLALGERTFVDVGSGQEAPCLYDESLYTTESATGDVISEYLANPGELKSYKVGGTLSVRRIPVHNGKRDG